MYTPESNEINIVNHSKPNHYQVNHLNTKKSEPLRVVRQYVNPAIYIESPIYDMAPFRRSPLYLNYASDDEIYHKSVKVKRCCCLTNPHDCPCHPLQNGFAQTQEDYILQSSSQLLGSARESVVSQVSLKSAETGSTLKPAKYNPELRLSITSLTSQAPSTSFCVQDSLEKEEVFRKWCARKARQKKKREEEEIRLKEEKERERQKLIETERENFKKWLSNKKKDEEKRKKELEQKLEEDKLKQEMKEKRTVESDLHYQLWLKKKEEQMLEKKIKEQVEMIKKSEERQQRIEESIRAYNEWLKNSKNKPKPIPLNQGLQSLRSAVSVTYVNPTPWTPNIDLTPKPASQ